MRILLFIIFILSTAKIKAQCIVKVDTLKCWLVVLTKVSRYKQVAIVQCKEIQQFDNLCKGNILGYLDLFNRPLVADDFYILHKSSTKIRL
jgi:predicted alpha/beta-fold hydrolase